PPSPARASRVGPMGLPAPQPPTTTIPGHRSAHACQRGGGRLPSQESQATARVASRAFLRDLVSSIDTRRRPGMFAHILVPLDGSALSERALPMAQHLARSSPTTLHLLQVISLRPELEALRGSGSESVA